MTEPIKYLSVVSKILQTYQTELLKLFKKITQETIIPINNFFVFKTKLEREIKILKEVQDQKSIMEDKVSDICQPMMEYLSMITRVKNTSQSQRYRDHASLQTQERKRFSVTGEVKRNIPLQMQPIKQTAQMNEIIRSFKIQSEMVPRMRMKWRSLQMQENKNKNNTNNSKQTIGDNNIELLSYAIPEIEDSIKRLSLQSSYAKQRNPQKLLEAYQTLDTRNTNRKKFVARLI